MTVDTSDERSDTDTSSTSSTEPSTDAVAARAHLLPEEVAAGSDDPHRQAEVILEESAERVVESGDPSAAIERRTSEDTVEPSNGD
jgi:hypothetical protein